MVTFSRVGDDTNKKTEQINAKEGDYYYFFIKARNSGIEIEKKDTLSLDEAYSLVGPTTNEDDNTTSGDDKQPNGEPSPATPTPTTVPDNANDEPSIFYAEGEYLDLDAINNTDSSQDDSEFVGRTYHIIGKVSEAYPPSDGFDNAVVIIETDVVSKGMPFHYFVQICIWMSVDDFDVISGVESVGTQIDVSVELTDIIRNDNSLTPENNGYVIDLYFGEPY